MNLHDQAQQIVNQERDTWKNKNSTAGLIKYNRRVKEVRQQLEREKESPHTREDKP